jgi:uncharacterized SAM-binding protein YcdF (DUF218 family)
MGACPVAGGRLGVSMARARVAPPVNWTAPAPARPSARPGVTLLLCRALGLLALIGVTLATLTPLPTWLARAAATPPSLGPAGAIVVLGGGFSEDGQLGPSSLRRLVHGIVLQRAKLAPLLVLSGQSRRHGPSESEVRADLARALGVAPEVILVVDARTTREEATRTAAALRPRGVHRILLVTDSLHLARARGVFIRAGLEVLAAPAPDPELDARGPLERLSLARALAREIVARGYYRLAGYL